jgi:hypothetical protein
MSLERTIDKMNRDSSIIESISSQHVAIPKLGTNPSGPGDNQDAFRPMKIEMNPTCKQLLASIRPMAAINVSREDSPDAKDSAKQNLGSPDRSMPPPPPRMPPAGQETLTNRDSLGSGQAGWTIDKNFVQHMIPTTSGISGSANMGRSGPARLVKSGDLTALSTGQSSGDHEGSFSHGVQHRPPHASGVPGMDNDSQVDGVPYPTDALPTCRISPHRLEDLLIYNWSNVWSLHNLRYSSHS